MLMVYRATPHAATGETPYHLVMGMDMVLLSMQEWAESIEVTDPFFRMRTLGKLREEAFERTARQAVARDASSSKYKKEPLEPGDLVLSWMDPNERGRLRRTSGGTKALPLWSGPCRVIRKLQSRKDAYVVRRLWEGGKAKEFQRESLMKLPREWDRESAEAALKEMLADLREPPGRAEPEERYDESLEEKECGPVIHRQARGRKFIEELLFPAEEMVSLEREDKISGSTRARPGTADHEGRQRGKKRSKTHVQCMAWREVEGLMTWEKHDTTSESN